MKDIIIIKIIIIIIIIIITTTTTIKVKTKTIFFIRQKLFGYSPSSVLLIDIYRFC